MKRLSVLLAKKLVQNGAAAEMEKVYAYGIECTLSTLLIIALLLVFGIIINRTMHMLTFILAWLPLRMIIGGAHANTHFTCTIVSVALGVFSVLFSHYLSKAPVVPIVFIALCCYFVIFLTAPVVHKNHPISPMRYRKTRIIARIYAAAEGAAIVALAVCKMSLAYPSFMGYLSAVVLIIIGWFSKNTDKTHLYSGN